MKAEFLERIMKPAVYELKAGTSTSYAFISGQQILPKTISIIRGSDTFKVSRSGRGLLPKVGQMKSTFTSGESSPYKQNKPYKVQTSIWLAEGYKTIYYGTIGLTGASGKIEGDNGDLILFVTSDWKKVFVVVFIGLADPTRLPANLAEAAGFLKKQLHM